MINGVLVPGEMVARQREDSFTAAQVVSNLPSVPAGKLTVANIPIGGVAYGSLGTSSTDVAGQLWITDIFVPFNRTITKIGVLSGATATTDNILVAIYNSAGVLLGTSALAGQLLAGANTFQVLTLLNPITLLGPQQYFIAVQGNGTAAGAIRTVATATYIDVVSTVVAGTFGTVPATITPPTTFTANNAPIVYVQ